MWKGKCEPRRSASQVWDISSFWKMNFERSFSRGVRTPVANTVGAMAGYCSWNRLFNRFFGWWMSPNISIFSHLQSVSSRSQVIGKCRLGRFWENQTSAELLWRGYTSADLGIQPCAWRKKSDWRFHLATEHPGDLRAVLHRSFSLTLRSIGHWNILKHDLYIFISDSYRFL